MDTSILVTFSSLRYTASGNNLRIVTPTPALPRWGRVLKENADYALLEYR